MADMHGIAQIEMVDDGRGIGGIVVHIVAFRHLTGTTVTMTIETDNSITVLEEK
jgi:hypothetical protein